MVDSLVFLLCVLEEGEEVGPGCRVGFDEIEVVVLSWRWVGVTAYDFGAMLEE